MNTADDGTPKANRQPDESELGPEPDWLLEAERIETRGSDPAPEPPAQSKAEPEMLPEPDPGPISGPEPVLENEPVETTHFQEVAVLPAATPAEEVPATVAEKRIHPWMWAALPFVFLLATGIIAWFAGTQALNDLSTWEALRAQQPALIPARWAMLTWWLILPLLAVFLIYGLLPAGREVTRIRLTGPLVSVALITTSLWIFSQHWDWEVVGLISIFTALACMLATYLLVALGPGITKVRQRIFSVIPLSASLAFGVMLTVLTWQGYSSQPFGDRGSSVLFVILLVIVAAVFAFFLRDGLFSLVLAIWFAGVIQQQWGEDAVISLVALVATLFTVALAVLGTILATESHRPSLTTSVASGRGRTSFFRKSGESSAGELP